MLVSLTRSGIGPHSEKFRPSDLSERGTRVLCGGPPTNTVLAHCQNSRVYTRPCNLPVERSPAPTRETSAEKTTFPPLHTMAQPAEEPATPAACFRAYSSISSTPWRWQGECEDGYIAPVRTVNEHGVSCPTGREVNDLMWTATPKLHGSNIQFDCVAGEAEVRVGRRGGYLGRTKDGKLTNPFDNDHYGSAAAAAALRLEDKLRVMLAMLQRQEDERAASAASAVGTDAKVAPARRICRVTAFGEVYGGRYGTEAAAGRKPVQAGIWYSPHIEIALFDVWVERTGEGCTGPATPVLGESPVEGATPAGVTGAFLPYTAARTACEAAGLPFVTAAFTGTLPAAHGWAHEHAADNAVTHWNPRGLAPLADNGGEGFVLRPLDVEVVRSNGSRGLFKVKNPRWSEIATGGGAGGGKVLGVKPGEEGSCACYASAVAAVGRYFTGPRAAAVFSKMPERQLADKYIPLLASAIIEDAKADAQAETSDGAEAGEASPGADGGDGAHTPPAPRWPAVHAGCSVADRVLKAGACRLVVQALKERRRGAYAAPVAAGGAAAAERAAAGAGCASSPASGPSDTPGASAAAVATLACGDSPTAATISRAVADTPAPGIPSAKLPAAHCAAAAREDGGEEAAAVETAAAAASS